MKEYSKQKTIMSDAVKTPIPTLNKSPFKNDVLKGKVVIVFLEIYP